MPIYVTDIQGERVGAAQCQCCGRVLVACHTGVLGKLTWDGRHFRLGDQSWTCIKAAMLSLLLSHKTDRLLTKGVS